MFVRAIWVLLLIAVAGCAMFQSTRGVAPDDVAALLDDEVFLSEAARSRLEPVSLYTLPPSLKRELDREIGVLATEEQRYRALRRWIFEEAGKYEYEPGATVAISDLPREGKINCFSFSVLYVAAARYLDMTADIQLVYSPPNWDISDDNWMLNQHINVAGSVRSAVDERQLRDRANLPLETGTHIRRTTTRMRMTQYVVDLNPDIIVNAHRTELLEDHQVLGRFYGNKAAEALVRGDHEMAYRYSRQAVLADGASAAGWNNLGVLYARSGHEDLARRAYLAAIGADPDADSARNNLALLYRRQGSDDAAASLERGIQARRRKNPYYHYLLGRQAFDAGNYPQAVTHYQNAVRRKRREQLFYLAMAEAQLALHRDAQARESLDRARQYAAADNADRQAYLERQLRLQGSRATESGDATTGPH